MPHSAIKLIPTAHPRPIPIRELRVMATYHGITKAICLNCGKVTQEDTALEILNDIDANCAACNMHLVAWHTQGEIIVTTQLNDDSDTNRYTIKAAN